MYFDVVVEVVDVVGVAVAVVVDYSSGLLKAETLN